MTILEDIIISLSFIALMIAVTVVFLIVSADAEEAPLPITVRIVTVEQSCIENGTNCEKIKDARVLNEMEPAAEAAQDGNKPELEIYE